jgi:hypothetical protein
MQYDQRPADIRRGNGYGVRRPEAVRNMADMTIFRLVSAAAAWVSLLSAGCVSSRRDSCTIRISDCYRKEQHTDRALSSRCLLTIYIHLLLLYACMRPHMHKLAMLTKLTKTSIYLYLSHFCDLTPHPTRERTFQIKAADALEWNKMQASARSLIPEREGIYISIYS